MSTPFNPTSGPVIFWGELEGPAGVFTLRPLLDTGATNTLIDPAYLVAAGYGATPATGRVRVDMGGGRVTVPILSVLGPRALGQRRTNLTVGAYTLPPGVNADGLLGLDFFRGYELAIDFRGGRITLA